MAKIITEAAKQTCSHLASMQLSVYFVILPRTNQLISSEDDHDLVITPLPH